MATNLPEKYELFNSQQTKEIGIIVCIDGVEECLSNRGIFRRIRYGDPGLKYGTSQQIYGGLEKIANVKALISLGGGVKITQKIEPEKGTGSISQFVLRFVDKDQFMTNLISPGIVIPDILGREVTVSLGYINTSFPEDYFRIFRGYFSEVRSDPGIVTLTISDPNFKRRQKLFFTANSLLSAPIDSVQTDIAVVSTSNFHQPILGPDGTFDTAITPYLSIENEFLEYDETGIASLTLVNVIARGSRSTPAVDHAAGAEVTTAVQVEDNAVTMALKLMLSGWNGPWLENVEITSLVDTFDITKGNNGDVDNAIVLPPNVDAKRDYGLVPGDYITVAGATNGSNNKTVTILAFDSLFDNDNRIILTSDTFIKESDSPATLDFRSQFDTYPITCGLKMTPKDIDVEGHIFNRNTFLAQTDNAYRFFIQATERKGKTFIETEVYAPIGTYGVTKQGRLAQAIIRPPLPGERLVYLDETNIINPNRIGVKRTTNGRDFFNEIEFSYDINDSGKVTSKDIIIDSDSLNIIGVSSTLPIKSRGARRDKGAANLFDRRGRLMLTRYKNSALHLMFDVNWEVASQIEVGDVVIVRDESNTLKISNFLTGKRGLDTQLFEVIKRSLDIKTGRASLDIISGIGFEQSDTYATIAPSSQIGPLATTTLLPLKDSFGALFPLQEHRKWDEYVGLTIKVHSADFSVTGETTIIGFDPVQENSMQVFPALAFTPPEDYIVDISDYPTDVDPTVNELYKQVHAFINPTVGVTASVNTFTFEVSPADIGKFLVDGFVRLHNEDYSDDTTDDRKITVVDAGLNRITVATDIGFTPDTTHFVELIGFFNDGGAPYRWI